MTLAIAAAILGTISAPTDQDDDLLDTLLESETFISVEEAEDEVDEDFDDEDWGDDDDDDDDEWDDDEDLEDDDLDLEY